MHRYRAAHLLNGLLGPANHLQGRLLGLLAQTLSLRAGYGRGAAVRVSPEAHTSVFFRGDEAELAADLHISRQSHR